MSISSGLSSHIDTRLLDPAEDTILRHLGRTWFVSSVSVERFKGNTYAHGFLKPSHLFTNSFLLEKEILFIFSPNSEFDLRALDFADFMIQRNPNRLDRLCAIVISRDLQIINKMRKRGIDDPESRFIIPFTYSELYAGSAKKDATASVYISRFNEFFYSRDLFAFTGPLHNVAHFFGRKQVIGDLYNKYRQGENAGLFGLRKIGKTSVLFAVKRRLESRDDPVLFVDCQFPAVHGKRWYRLLQFIIDRLVKQFRLSKSVKIHADLYNADNAAELFEEDLSEIHRALHKRRLLLILDEIEQITFETSVSAHWTEDTDFLLFWQTLRAVFQNNPSVFSFIVAGINPTCIETPIVKGHDNPIFSLAEARYLEFFNVKGVKEMVSYIGRYMGLLFDEEVFTHLTEDYGGHPFLIRQVCSCISNSIEHARPYTITPHAYRFERKAVDIHVKKNLKAILEILEDRYKDEYELLEVLAVGDQQTFDYFVRQSPSIVEHLIGYGLIKEYKNKWFFKMKVIEEFIQENTRRNKALATKTDKWQDITAKRNTLELALRNSVKRILKAHFGNAAKETFLQVISPPARKERLAERSQDEIFDGKAELYFEDLRKIVLKHWDNFGKTFGEDRFTFDQYMRFINDKRADAHAKDLGDDDLALLHIACNWLQSRADEFLK